MVARVLICTGLLAGLWLALSGEFTFEHGYLQVLGALSCLSLSALCERLGILDRAAERLLFGFRSAIFFFPWLLWQIIKSNLDVSRRIWTPSMPVGPRVIRVHAHQRTTLGLAVHANAITLTPGTLSVYAEPGMIEIHALSKDIAESLDDGAFDKRICRLEGNPPPSPSTEDDA